MSVHGIMRSVCLLVALTAVSVAAFSHSKSTNMTKEAHSTTMPFLETTTELQLSNTTFGQLSRHAFDIINQEFIPSRPLPENERVHEQHGLGFPVCLAHDPSGARPLGTVDLEGELDYYMIICCNDPHSPFFPSCLPACLPPASFPPPSLSSPFHPRTNRCEPGVHAAGIV
jgi:hypothetical protein